MEQTLAHLVHAAIWFFIIVFILAFIGLVAIIRWIVGLFRRGEAAVQTGVERVETTLHR
jgi:hypothetical protein